MRSKVWFTDLRTTAKANLYDKLGRLMDEAGLAACLSERELVAIKLHFGELGNTAYIRPVFLRKIVEKVKENGAKPFLTDANTLYAGSRGDSVDHLNTAIQNGFDYAVVGAPLIIADGLRGKSEISVPVNGEAIDFAHIGAEVVRADALISVAHFKGHELSGFGGAIKNIGMGAASRKGKMAQHSGVCPKVDPETCIGCGECESHCAPGAIAVQGETARIDGEKCIGCGECIIICPSGAVQIQWDTSIPVFLKRMVEYTQGVLANKAGKCFCINFITDVSPACDCLAHNDAPIVQDIGIVASFDPIAIDQASVDRVNQAAALPHSCLKENQAPGQDKFKGLYPKVDWPVQLEYGEAVGLGSRRYELIKL